MPGGPPCPISSYALLGLRGTRKSELRGSAQKPTPDRDTALDSIYTHGTRQSKGHKGSLSLLVTAERVNSPAPKRATQASTAPRTQWSDFIAAEWAIYYVVAHILRLLSTVRKGGKVGRIHSGEIIVAQ